jgi:hypothetical protein
MEVPRRDDGVRIDVVSNREDGQEITQRFPVRSGDRGEPGAALDLIAGKREVA